MNQTFTKDEIKAIEKFLNFAKEYYNEEARHYVSDNKAKAIFESMINNMVHADMMLIALKVCKEHKDEQGNVNVNVL